MPIPKINVMPQTTVEEMQGKLNEISNSNGSTEVKFSSGQKMKIDHVFNKTTAAVGKGTKAREAHVENYQGVKEKSIGMLSVLAKVLGFAAVFAGGALTMLAAAPLASTILVLGGLAMFFGSILADIPKMTDTPPQNSQSQQPLGQPV